MEGQAVYSATPLRTNPSDRFIGNEIFDYSSIELSDNDIYSQEFAILSDTFQGNNANPDQTIFRFLYEDLESWIDIAGSFIRVRARVATKTGGTSVPTEGVTIPDARILWEQVIFKLGCTEVENHSKDYWAYAQMSNKLWSNKFTNTVGSIMGLQKTRYGQPGLEFSENNYYNINNNPNSLFLTNCLPPYAVGLGGIPALNSKCIDWAGNGEGQLNMLQDLVLQDPGVAPTLPPSAGDCAGSLFEFWIPLSTVLAFSQAYPRVIKGVKFELELHKANNSISCYAPDVANKAWTDPLDHQVQMSWDRQGVQLYMRRIRANESIERSLTSRLVDGINYKINFENWYMDRLNFSKNQTKVEHRIVNVGSLPTKVWTVFQDARTMTDMGRPSWAFTIPNLTDIQLFVNGQLVPQNIIKMDIGDVGQPNQPTQIGDGMPDDHSIPYQMYLQMCGTVQNGSPYMRNFKGGSGNLTYQEWRSTCPMFCWDLGNVAITPFFEGRAEIVIRFTKYISEPPPLPPAPEVAEPDNYNMFTCVHCLRSVELSMKEHRSLITMNNPKPPFQVPP